MGVAEEAVPRDGADVLRALRTATAPDHERVEAALDLLAPDLDRARLAEVLTRLHSFWVAAEAGLDAWARREPADARAVGWSRRRRAGLFDADLHVLGALGRPGGPELPDAPDLPGGPDLPEVADTDEALGRLYVLEGSTLGGVFIDRHLAGLPGLVPGGRLRAFSPYGAGTGAMWREFRRATRARVAAGADVDRIVAAAGDTFAALAAWCRPLAAVTA